MDNKNDTMPHIANGTCDIVSIPSSVLEHQIVTLLEEHRKLLVSNAEVMAEEAELFLPGRLEDVEFWAQKVAASVMASSELREEIERLSASLLRRLMSPR